MATGKHGAAWTRPLRRLFRGFLTKEEKRRVAALIGELEGKTTGEIHVHLVGKAGPDVMAEAKGLFAKLSLDKTEHRNAVLLLISHLDHRFAIWGDEGIHAKAGQHLWDRAATTLREHFAERRYPEGVEACVRAIGTELARHFPGRGNRGVSNDVTES